MEHAKQQVGFVDPLPASYSTYNSFEVNTLQGISLATYFVKSGFQPPVGERPDSITIGDLTASRITSVPLDAKKRWAHSATLIEIETGRDYRVTGGTDWFEIRDGVVFSVQGTATVAWTEGPTNIGPGLWLIRIAH